MVDAGSPEGGDALEQAREQLHSLNLRASAPTRGGEGVVRERVRVLEAVAGGPAGRSDGTRRRPPDASHRADRTNTQRGRPRRPHPTDRNPRPRGPAGRHARSLHTSAQRSRTARRTRMPPTVSATR